MYTKLIDFLRENVSYNFDRTRLTPLIKNARKWSEKDFIEEYVDWNDISLAEKHMNRRISKGDSIEMTRKVRGADGKYAYDERGMQMQIPYKTVVADKDYGDNHWTFIMDNTQEIQEEAKRVYAEHKNAAKPKFRKNSKTMRAYHASPYRFETFKRGGEQSTSGQVGADVGIYFFAEKKNADYYASVLKDNNGKAYLYEVDIQLGKVLRDKGEDVGTNWGRYSYLEQAEIEGFNTVIIEDADTGYGITTEIVVFDDDNIHIVDVKEL